MSLPVEAAGVFVMILQPGAPAPVGDRPWHRVSDGVYVAHDGCGEGLIHEFPATLQKCGDRQNPRRYVVTVTTPVDRDANGRVEVNDLLRYLAAFHRGDADWDGSGATDVYDLLAFLGDFRDAA